MSEHPRYIYVDFNDMESPGWLRVRDGMQPYGLPDDLTDSESVYVCEPGVRGEAYEAILHVKDGRWTAEVIPPLPESES